MLDDYVAEDKRRKYQ